jgi:N-acetylneuraminic acid mutarotase
MVSLYFLPSPHEIPVRGILRQGKEKIMKIASVFIGLTILLLLLTAADPADLSPSPRGYHQMTFDTESNRIVLFGGQTGYWRDPAQVSRETWVFDPETAQWTQMFPDVSPDISAGGDMTYDSHADRSILSFLTFDWTTLETWAYDVNSNTWERKADGPGRRLGQRLAYDSESDRVVLFGGFDMSTFKLVDETWAYDYNTDTWTNMQPDIHPKMRNYHGMVYDPKVDRVVVWGGDVKGADKPEVWLYDYNTNTWEKRTYSHGPDVRDYCFLAYDKKSDRVIMYGGYAYGNDETWVYDVNTNTWKQMQPEQNPGVISRYTMVYAGNRTILFGGQDGPNNFVYKNETWSYNLKANLWRNISPGQ